MDKSYYFLNIYGLKPTHNIINMFSEYKILKYINFVNTKDTSRPLLIVGSENIDNFELIDKDNIFLSENVMWCYSPDEYINYFIKQFKEILNNIFNVTTKYNKFINISLFDKNIDFNYLINKIESSNIVYKREKIIYCYINFETYIFNIHEFVHFNKFDNTIFNNYIKNGKIIDDNEDKIFLFFKDIFNNIDNFFIERNIPFLISLK
jgi:hypothetical protein